MKATLILCGVFLWAMGLSAETSDTEEEKQVMATLEALFQAYPKRDAATLNRLYHDDLSLRPLCRKPPNEVRGHRRRQ